MADNTADDDLLKEATDRLQHCIDATQENNLEALDDLRFANGDQWPDDMRGMREIDNRPCLTINKLVAFIHSVTNDQRQNCPSIKVHAVDDDADPKTADVMQGLIRHIEYNSNADVAYDTAVNSAAKIGFGFFRLITEYCSDDSFDQDIKFKRIRNPFTVYIDPAAQEPDGSDMRYCFITDWLDEDEFEREYPDSVISQGNLEAGANDVQPIWIDTGRIRIAEYMRIEEKPERLYRMPDGSSAWKSDLEGATDKELSLLKSRMSAKREVWWYKITGAEVLEKKKIDCPWIPVFPVYGDETDIEGKVWYAGIVRHAKDSQRMYNFWMTSATEEVSLRPKTPYIGAEGQFEGYENEWSQANNKSYAYLQYVPVSIDGTPAPAPQRQPMADVPAGMITMAMHASDDIKATTGIFDASLGAKGNETSGKAILARQNEGDTANFHYSDNLVRTLRHAARCLMKMIPFVYDVQRVIKVMGEDGKMSHATINQPQTKVTQDPQTGLIQAVDTVLHDTSVAEYDVTVSAGPSYSTLRQETLAQLLELNQSWPKLMDIAGDKVVQTMDMHGAEEIAERIKRTIPPNIIGPEMNDQDPEQVITQLQGQLSQAQQQLQGMQHQIQMDQQQIQALNAKAQVTIESAQIKEQGATQRAEMQEQYANQREQLKLGTQTQHIAMKEQGANVREVAKHQAATTHVGLKEYNQNARQASQQDGQSSSDVLQLQIAQMNNESKESIAALTGMVQLMLANMQTPPQIAEEATPKD